MVIKSRIRIGTGFLTLCLGVLPCLAAQLERNIPQAPDPRVSEMAGKIQQTLDQTLTGVNETKRFSQGELAAGQNALNESRRYFLQMDDKQKAEYCLLQSWIAYYSRDINVAHLNAVKACKLEASNGDAWTTQIIMALMSDKKPIIPKVSKPAAARPQPANRANRPARVPRNRPGQMGMESPDVMRGGTESTITIQKGKLDFDVYQFQAEAIDKPIEALSAVAVKGDLFTYQPGNTILCALVWRKFENETPAQNREKPDLAVGESPEAAPREQSLDDASIAAFDKLFKMAGTSASVKFLAINLDSAEHKNEIVGEINKQSRPWPELLSSAQDKKLFGGLEMTLRAVSPAKPILIMTDPNGIVRYAGPVGGIVAPMLLSKIASVKMVSDKTAETPAVMDSNLLPPADSNSLPQTKQTPPLVTQNNPQVPAQQAVTPGVQTRALSEEDKIQAEKLVTFAEDVFMKGGGKRVITYKRGIDLCRQVMKDYPGTEYAEKARQLLRQVPENQRSRYGLTDQELGL